MLSSSYVPIIRLVGRVARGVKWRGVVVLLVINTVFFGRAGMAHRLPTKMSSSATKRGYRARLSLHFSKMPNLPTILGINFLSSIRSHPSLPKQSWYFIAAVTLSTINRPDEVQRVYKYALEHGAAEQDSSPTQSQQLYISRRIREALVKASAIGGVPRVSQLLSCHDAIQRRY